jgi:hypothetical protein
MPNQHYIGAIAGGILNSTVVEIKCPFAAESMTVHEFVANGY